MMYYKLRPVCNVYLAVIALFFASFLSAYIITNADRTASLGASVIMATAVASWFLFSSMWGFRDRPAVMLAAISGIALAIPSLSVLGPVSWPIVGTIAGFAAFVLRGMTRSWRVYLAVSVYAISFGLLLLANFAAQTLHIWDTGGGIGAWTGTADLTAPSFWDFSTELYLVSIAGLIAMFAVIKHCSGLDGGAK